MWRAVRRLTRRQSASAIGLFADEYGRRDELGLHARLVTENLPESGWEDFVRGWEELGATEFAIYPHGEAPDDYIKRLRPLQGHVRAFERPR